MQVLVIVHTKKTLIEKRCSYAVHHNLLNTLHSIKVTDLSNSKQQKMGKEEISKVQTLIDAGL